MDGMARGAKRIRDESTKRDKGVWDAQIRGTGRPQKDGRGGVGAKRRGLAHSRLCAATVV